MSEKWQTLSPELRRLLMPSTINNVLYKSWLLTILKLQDYGAVRLCERKREAENCRKLQKTEVPVYLNRRKITRTTVDEAKLMRTQTGKNSFELA